MNIYSKISHVLFRQRGRKELIAEHWNISWLPKLRDRLHMYIIHVLWVIWDQLQQGTWIYFIKVVYFVNLIYFHHIVFIYSCYFDEDMAMQEASVLDNWSYSDVLLLVAFICSRIRCNKVWKLDCFCSYDKDNGNFFGRIDHACLSLSSSYSCYCI